MLGKKRLDHKPLVIAHAIYNNIHYSVSIAKMWRNILLKNVHRHSWALGWVLPNPVGIIFYYVL